MTPDEVIDFLSSGRKTLQVATIGKDGVPHVAPMWFVVDDGKVVFRSFTKSQKMVNLQRDQRLTVLVETGDTYETLRGVMRRTLSSSGRYIHMSGSRSSCWIIRNRDPRRSGGFSKWMYTRECPSFLRFQ